MYVWRVYVCEMRLTGALPLAATVLIVMVTVPSPASADQWRPRITHQRVGRTQIRVLGPAGYNVRIGGRTDTAPAIFRLRNRDDYVWVEIRARNGAVWRRKLEVRRGHETTVSMVHSLTRYSMGHIRNTTQFCAGAHTIRVDVMQGGRSLLSKVIGPRQSASGLRLARGSYTARVYEKKAGRWVPARPGTITATGARWKFEYGCQPVGPVGRVSNSTAGCPAFNQGTFRFHFKNPRSFAIIRTVGPLNTGQTAHDIALPAGRYWVVPEKWHGRYYAGGFNSFFFDVKKKGWHMNYQCTRR